MNAPLMPEVLLGRSDDTQASLELATAGVLRYVWDSRYGRMLIEVVGDRIFVNGQPVERAISTVGTDPRLPGAAGP